MTDCPILTEDELFLITGYKRGQEQAGQLKEWKIPFLRRKKGGKVVVKRSDWYNNEQATKTEQRTPCMYLP